MKFRNHIALLPTVLLMGIYLQDIADPSNKGETYSLFPKNDAKDTAVQPVKDTVPAADSSRKEISKKKHKKKKIRESTSDTTDPWKPKSVTKPVPYNSYREKPKPQEEAPVGDILRSIITEKKKN